jgi:SAM-dependent methyltransferase
MSAQYDGVAEQFASTEAQTSRIFADIPSVFELLGDVRGKAVLDLACGNGLVTRLHMERGAARVVGADISEDMIRIARKQAQEAGLGIEYHVQDAVSAPLGDGFDAITALWLLNYAETSSNLARMCKNVHDSLKPGGRFVALVPNPEMLLQAPNYERYRVTTRLEERFEDHCRADLEFHTQPPFSVKMMVWSLGAYHRALRSAGFRSIVWAYPECTPEGEQRFGADYWSLMREHPYALVIRAEKAGGASA